MRCLPLSSIHCHCAGIGVGQIYYGVCIKRCPGIFIFSTFLNHTFPNIRALLFSQKIPTVLFRNIYCVIVNGVRQPGFQYHFCYYSVYNYRKAKDHISLHCAVLLRNHRDLRYSERLTRFLLWLLLYVEQEHFPRKRRCLVKSNSMDYNRH